MMKTYISIGQTVRFDPFKQMTGFAVQDNQGKMVEGTVLSVFIMNQWFLVEYECGGENQRASFKFSQIGKDVFVCD